MMTDNPLRTPDEWQKMLGVKVLDPDGWDRRNLEESWSEPISEDEFRIRASMSTTARVEP